MLPHSPEESLEALAEQTDSRKRIVKIEKGRMAANNSSLEQELQGTSHIVLQKPVTGLSAGAADSSQGDHTKRRANSNSH